MERIIKYLESIGVPAGADILSKFEVYYRELIEWNERFNLTAVTDRDGVIIKHFIDSLTAVKYIPEGARLIDIGSGAGFPAIPLKIVRPDINITMLDSLNKRVNFLNHIIETLGLKGAEAVHGRAEDFASGKMRGAYDVAAARAVAELCVLMEYCVPYVKRGGVFIAYKSPEAREEITAAANAFKALKCELKEAEPFTLYGSGAGRMLIIIKKTGDTPAIYPRGGNLPKKKPL